MVSTRLFALSLVVSLAQASITSRLSAAGIQYVTSSSPSWSRYSTPFNKRLTYQPKVIAFPSNAQQVAAAVVAGRAEKLRVTPKSGGHSYTAYSLGGEANHLVLDLGRMNATVVTRSTAAIQPGSRLGDAALNLNAQGAKALPHGVCPYVGVGGHAAFGGFGQLSRQWGLTLDRMSYIKVVLANGTLVTATATNAPDLFWALRGSGASFGVVVEYGLKTVPQPPSVIVFSYSWNLNAANAASAFASWQSFGLSNPNRALSANLNVGKGSSARPISVSLDGAFYGTQQELQSTVAPFLKKMPAPLSTDFKPGNYMTSLQNLAGDQALSTKGVDLYGEHDTFYAKSMVTYQKSPISKAGLTALAKYLATTGKSSSLNWFVQLELYGGNSAINDVPQDKTAYAHRDALWTIQFYASSKNYAPPFPSSGFGFVDSMVSAIVSNQVSGWPYGAYTNYVDDRLSTSQWQKQYYGAKYARLQRIKAIYDPSNVFGFPQAITKPGISRRRHAFADFEDHPSAPRRFQVRKM